MLSQVKSKIPKPIRRTIKSGYKFLLEIFNYFLNFLDFFIPKRKDYWIFPVYFLGEGDFSDNILAVFEAVKNDGSIRKIILFRNKKITINNGKNVKLVKMSSLKASWFLMRAKIFIVQHSLTYELRSIFKPTYPRRRMIINLWHGVVVKDLAHPQIGIMNNKLKKELVNHYIITSSEKDKINMQKVFYTAKKENFWLTGLPRNDFLLMDEKKLPETIKQEHTKIRSLIKDKKLIIYTPTYREKRVGGYYYQFRPEELKRLKDFLQNNNFILGVRYHKYNEPVDLLRNIVDDETIIDVSTKIISNMNVLIREADIIVTDYSSIYVDAMYLKKPLISFVYDFDHYLTKQHGFLYQFDTVFPGKMCYTFDEMMEALDQFVSGKELISKEKFEEIYKIFFKYYDANNTQRVINRVDELLFNYKKIKNY